ncbi:hypothetical protein [Nioella aestuarii]|uniref:hypothetical protein n=1 Tax=Nioella aestuarii TaxID=1662864 RepID=UPI003D7F6606
MLIQSQHTAISTGMCRNFSDPHFAITPRQFQNYHPRSANGRYRRIGSIDQSRSILRNGLEADLRRCSTCFFSIGAPPSVGRASAEDRSQPEADTVRASVQPAQLQQVGGELGRSPLEIEAILQSTGEGIQNILDAINAYNELLYDVVIPRLFGLLYDLEQHEITDEHEVELVRLPENGSYSVMADPKLVVRDDDVEERRQHDRRSDRTG